jgi:hypothetical protein
MLGEILVSEHQAHDRLPRPAERDGLPTAVVRARPSSARAGCGAGIRFTLPPQRCTGPCRLGTIEAGSANREHGIRERPRLHKIPARRCPNCLSYSIPGGGRGRGGSAEVTEVPTGRTGRVFLTYEAFTQFFLVFEPSSPLAILLIEINMCRGFSC